MLDIQKIIKAELWGNGDFNEAPEMKNILNSGLLVGSADLKTIINSASAGFSFKLPFVNEPTYTESNVMDDSNTTVPVEDFKWEEQKAVLGLYSKSYKYANIVTAVGRDTDPAKIIRDIVGNYWAKDIQRRAIASLSSIATIASTLQLNIADDSISGNDVLLSAVHVLDAIAKQGDNQDKFSFIFLHSKVYTDLRKQDLITDVIPSQNPSLKPIPFFGQYRVIVNDLMPVIQGTNKTKYLSVISQAGLFAYEDKNLGSDMPLIELYRDPRAGNGAGTTQVIARKGFTIHPLGWSYTQPNTSLSPMISDLNTVANWSKVFEDKKQKFVSIITN